MDVAVAASDDGKTEVFAAVHTMLFFHRRPRDAVVRKPDAFVAATTSPALTKQIKLGENALYDHCP